MAALSAAEMQELLNDQVYWPKSYMQKLRRALANNGPSSDNKNPNSCKLPASPIHNVRIEEQTVSVQHQINATRPVYIIEFHDMQAFNHYRREIAMGQVELGYRPRLYHEQDTPIQMLMGMVDYTYYDWVEIDYDKLKFHPYDQFLLFSNHLF
jgi:hypothetical protein